MLSAVYGHAAAMLRDDDSFDGYGIYHLAGAGDVNWSGFARHMLDTSARYGGPTARVRDIATSDYPTKARRPANSRLSSEKFASAFEWTAPVWQVSAEKVVCRLAGSKTKQALSA